MSSGTQNKPQNSKIILVKNSDSFKAILFPRGFNSIDTYTNLLLLVFLIIFCPIVAAEFDRNNIALFLLGFIVGIFYLIFKICLNIWGIMKLQIDPKIITLTYSLWGRGWNDLAPDRKQNIKTLKKYCNYNRQSAYLAIATQKSKYYVSTNSSFILSIAEVDWLGSELSQWLDLPLAEQSINSDRNIK